MTTLPPSGPGVEDAAVAHLSALSSEISGILTRFRVTEQESTALLREVLLLTAYRWDLVESHDLWLLATVRRGCLRLVRRRAQNRSH
ncbi:MAG TPA: hypothetical protein VLE27_05200 [Thermoanaerobaculia bacterium]|nr:hypothetical protein [Thermoanaerobaculia bacterium]